MNHHTGRFIYNYKVFVFEYYFERNVLRADVAFFGNRYSDFNAITFGYFGLRIGLNGAVYPHIVAIEQTSNART